MRTITISYARVKVGDVLIDAMGRPFFRVTEVHQARKPGYLVFFGDNLVRRDGVTAGGHKSNFVTIEVSDNDPRKI